MSAAVTPDSCMAARRAGSLRKPGLTVEWLAGPGLGRREVPST